MATAEVINFVPPVVSSPPDSCMICTEDLWKNAPAGRNVDRDEESSRGALGKRAKDSSQFGDSSGRGADGNDDFQAHSVKGIR